MSEPNPTPSAAAADVSRRKLPLDQRGLTSAATLPEPSRGACPTEILVTSPWVPVEWIAAHGFTPRGVWSLANPAVGAVAEGVCAFAHAARGFSETLPQTPVIFTTACDQMRRAADAVGGSAQERVFLFNLPATWQTPAARRLYHAEVERLGSFLQRLGGHAPTDGELEAVMRHYDERRLRLQEFVQQAPARYAAEAMARFYDGDASRTGFAFPLTPALSPVEREARHAASGEPEHAGLGSALHPILPLPRGEGRGAGERRPRSSRDGSLRDSRVSLALVGGPLSAPEWDLFDLIESVGGSVVLNATEPGERCLLPSGIGFQPVADLRSQADGCLKMETGGTPVLRDGGPLARLCDHYFGHIVDVFQRPNSRLYDWLGARLTQRHVRGIVLWVHVGCDLWRAEAASLREAFGLPVLVLDTTETRGAGLRDLSRLAAFIESLRPALQSFVAYATKDCRTVFDTAAPPATS